MEEEAISIMNKMKEFFHRFLNERGYYKLEDLQGYGHCGLCGKYMPDTPMEKDWPWGICDECKKGEKINEEQ